MIFVNIFLVGALKYIKIWSKCQLGHRPASCHTMSPSVWNFSQAPPILLLIVMHLVCYLPV